MAMRQQAKAQLSLLPALPTSLRLSWRRSAAVVSGCTAVPVGQLDTAQLAAAVGGSDRPTAGWSYEWPGHQPGALCCGGPAVRILICAAVRVTDSKCSVQNEAEHLQISEYSAVSDGAAAR